MKKWPLFKLLSATKVFLCLGVLLGQNVHAQQATLLRQTVGAAGTTSSFSINDQTYLVQQSIGQASVIGTFTAADTQLRQGFIQAPAGPRAVQEETLLNVHVYPNPFNRGFNLQFEEALEDQSELQLFDITGRLVFEYTFMPQIQAYVPIGALPAGSYVLQLRVGNRSYTANLQRQ